MALGLPLAAMSHVTHSTPCHCHSAVAMRHAQNRKGLLSFRKPVGAGGRFSMKSCRRPLPLRRRRWGPERIIPVSRRPDRPHHPTPRGIDMIWRDEWSHFPPLSQRSPTSDRTMVPFGRAGGPDHSNLEPPNVFAACGALEEPGGGLGHDTRGMRFGGGGQTGGGPRWFLCVVLRSGCRHQKRQRWRLAAIKSRCGFYTLTCTCWQNSSYSCTTFEIGEHLFKPHRGSNPLRFAQLWGHVRPPKVGHSEPEWPTDVRDIRKNALGRESV